MRQYEEGSHTLSHGSKNRMQCGRIEKNIDTFPVPSVSSYTSFSLNISFHLAVNVSCVGDSEQIIEKLCVFVNVCVGRTFGHT